MIRLAETRDAAAVLAIYAPYISDTSFTFEAEVPSIDAFADRIRSYLQHWPWLVFESEGRIAGYAYASKYRERVGYQWCVECSVYIHDDFQKMGVARALYQALFRILRLQGYFNVYAVINLPNEPSVRLHESCGFTWFADYKNVGYKLGRWKTVGWWQLQLQEYRDNPDPPIPLTQLDPGAVKGMLKDNS